MKAHPIAILTQQAIGLCVVILLFGLALLWQLRLLAYIAVAANVFVVWRFIRAARRAL